MLYCMYPTEFKKPEPITRRVDPRGNKKRPNGPVKPGGVKLSDFRSKVISKKSGPTCGSTTMHTVHNDKKSGRDLEIELQALGPEWKYERKCFPSGKTEIHWIYKDSAKFRSYVQAKEYNDVVARVLTAPAPVEAADDSLIASFLKCI